MADIPQQPQSPTDVVNAVNEAWSAWVRAATPAMTGSPASGVPLQQLTAALRSYAGAVTAPIRELSRQQRDLADSMEQWARLQRDLAGHVQTWAEQQRRLADTLDSMVGPLAAFTPDGD